MSLGIAMIFRAPTSAVVAAFVLIAPSEVFATIGAAPGTTADFDTSLAMCLNHMQTADPQTAALLAALDSSAQGVLVRRASPVGDGSYEDPDTKLDSINRCSGGTGRGTGSRVSWDYQNTTPYVEGVARDPCASLVHELHHALDDANGVDMPRTSGNGVAPYTEARAVEAENRYRASQGLPLRPSYTGLTLPPGPDPLCPGNVTTCCNQACVDATSSSTNCGSCGTVCASNQLCSAGTCACDPLACAGTCCGSGCVDTNSDFLNCGACGHACATGQVCQIGLCVTGWLCDGSHGEPNKVTGFTRPWVGYCPPSTNTCEKAGGTINPGAICYVGPNYLANWECPTGYNDCGNVDLVHFCGLYCPWPQGGPP
jgi:hypothetical protein